MYICPHCDVPYDAPLLVYHSEDLDGEGHFWTRTEELCHICGQPVDRLGDKADRCDCGRDKWKPVREPCCKACRKELRGKYVAFAMELTAGQSEALYEEIDGVGVAELLNKWRIMNG